MSFDAQRLAALEEELKRDLEAIGRVRQLMEFKNGALRPPDDRQAALPINIMLGDSLAPGDSLKMSDEGLEDLRVSSIRGTIESILNANPGARWTCQKMLSHLQRTGFPLRAQKPIYSVGQAMQKLADSGKIKLLRRGTGNLPNIYRGKDKEGSTAMDSGHKE